MGREEGILHELVPCHRMANFLLEYFLYDLCHDLRKFTVSAAVENSHQAVLVVVEVKKLNYLDAKSEKDVDDLNFKSVYSFEIKKLSV